MPARLRADSAQKDTQKSLEQCGMHIPGDHGGSAGCLDSPREATNQTRRLSTISRWTGDAYWVGSP